MKHIILSILESQVTILVAPIKTKSTETTIFNIFEVFDKVSPLLPQVNEPEFAPYLSLAFTIYLLGILGMLFNYKNFLITMMAVELMYLGIICSFVVIGADGANEFANCGLLVIILAACESAIGLGLLIILYRFGQSVSFNDYEKLQSNFIY